MERDGEIERMHRGHVIDSTHTHTAERKRCFLEYSGASDVLTWPRRLFISHSQWTAGGRRRKESQMRSPSFDPVSQDRVCSLIWRVVTVWCVGYRRNANLEQERCAQHCSNYHTMGKTWDLILVIVWRMKHNYTHRWESVLLVITFTRDLRFLRNNMRGSETTNFY